MDMTVTDAYQRSIQTLSGWLHREVNTSKTHVIYRTYAPVHFRSVQLFAYQWSLHSSVPYVSLLKNYLTVLEIIFYVLYIPKVNHMTEKSAWSLGPWTTLVFSYWLFQNFYQFYQNTLLRSVFQGICWTFSLTRNHLYVLQRWWLEDRRELSLGNSSRFDATRITGGMGWPA